MVLDALPAFINALKFVVPLVTILAQVFIISCKCCLLFAVIGGNNAIASRCGISDLCNHNTRLGNVESRRCNSVQGIKDVALGALGTAMMSIGGGIGGKLLGGLGIGIGKLGGAIGFGKVASGVTGAIGDFDLLTVVGRLLHLL